VNLLWEAREKFLDIRGDKMSLQYLADEYGISYQELYKAYAEERWEHQRRQKLAQLDSILVSTNAKQREITEVRTNLFNLDVELVERTHQLLAYIDNLMANGGLGGKEAVTYLKLLMDTSHNIQKNIDKAIGQAQGDDTEARKLIEDLKTKALALRVLKGDNVSTGRELDSKRDIMRGFDAEPQ